VEANSSDIRTLNGALWRMVESFRRGFSQVVDPVRYGVLQTVAAEGRVRPTEIALALDVVPSSVTRAVQALAEDGLVALEANPDDGRSSFVVISERGRARLRRFEDDGVAVTAAVMADWSRDDLRQLTALLERLTSTWEAHGPSKRRPGRLGRPTGGI
jgi:DNA-binding MarR family transcriptional regulator